MHFRIRKHVVQLIRTIYEPDLKRGKTKIITTIKLSNLKITEDLHQILTSEEIVEFEIWIKTHFRVEMLRNELAVLSLTEQMELAQNWFEQNHNNDTAQLIARDIIYRWQALRKVLYKQGLLD